MKDKCPYSHLAPDSDVQKSSTNGTTGTGSAALTVPCDNHLNCEVQDIDMATKSPVGV